MKAKGRLRDTWAAPPWQKKKIEAKLVMPARFDGPHTKEEPLIIHGDSNRNVSTLPNTVPALRFRAEAEL